MIRRLGPSFFGTTKSLEKYIGRWAGVGIFLMTPEERRRGMNSRMVGRCAKLGMVCGGGRSVRGGGVTNSSWRPSVIILVATTSPRDSQADFRVERRVSQFSSSWLFCGGEKAERDPSKKTILWNVCWRWTGKGKSVLWKKV